MKVAHSQSYKNTFSSSSFDGMSSPTKDDCIRNTQRISSYSFDLLPLSII